VLLFADEREALTHPYLARAWAKRGADLRVPAPGQAKKVAMIGALDHAARRLVVHTSNQAQRRFHYAVGAARRPRPGLPIRPVVVVLDNGPIHLSKASIAALAASAHWLTVEWLPSTRPNSTTLNPSGAISKPTISPTRPSPTPTTSTGPFTPRLSP
jgi:hypothetical protein